MPGISGVFTARTILPVDAWQAAAPPRGCGVRAARQLLPPSVANGGNSDVGPTGELKNFAEQIAATVPNDRRLNPAVRTKGLSGAHGQRGCGGQKLTAVPITSHRPPVCLSPKLSGAIRRRTPVGEIIMAEPLEIPGGRKKRRRRRRESKSDIKDRLAAYFGIESECEILSHLGVDLGHPQQPYIGPPLTRFPDGTTTDVWGVAVVQSSTRARTTKSPFIPPLVRSARRSSVDTRAPARKGEMPRRSPSRSGASKMKASSQSRYPNSEIPATSSRLHESSWLRGPDRKSRAARHRPGLDQP
jgi:hypothetical protein